MNRLFEGDEVFNTYYALISMLATIFAYRFLVSWLNLYMLPEGWRVAYWGGITAIGIYGITMTLLRLHRIKENTARVLAWGFGFLMTYLVVKPLGVSLLLLIYFLIFVLISTGLTEIVGSYLIPRSTMLRHKIFTLVTLVLLSITTYVSGAWILAEYMVRFEVT
ncbi:MAG: hypothetical protein DRO11_00010 [Methanobacteriota archaeon]|nr:MAG: hypothetical protein DRO11_00010 [Euryarchaeota archaeon]